MQAGLVDRHLRRNVAPRYWILFVSNLRLFKHGLYYVYCIRKSFMQEFLLLPCLASPIRVSRLDASLSITRPADARKGESGDGRPDIDTGSAELLIASAASTMFVFFLHRNTFSRRAIAPTAGRERARIRSCHETAGGDISLAPSSEMPLRCKPSMCHTSGRKVSSPAGRSLAVLVLLIVDGIVSAAVLPPLICTNELPLEEGGSGNRHSNDCSSYRLAFTSHAAGHVSEAQSASLTSSAFGVGRLRGNSLFQRFFPICKLTFRNTFFPLVRCLSGFFSTS